MNAGNTTASLLNEIETLARNNLSFSGREDSAYSILMKMKIQLDCHYKEATRLPKELSVLYKRFCIQASEKVIPEL